MLVVINCFFSLLINRRQSILVIRKAKETDTGVYKCEAKNVFGSVHATTRVSLSPQPQKPVKPPPSPKPVGKLCDFCSGGITIDADYLPSTYTAFRAFQSLIDDFLL